MSETVTITPLFGHNSDGDPNPAGAPFTAEAFVVAPGNTSYSYGATGDTDTAEFTVFLPVGTAVKDDDMIEVRNRKCLARVREWHSLKTERAVLEVLCRSATGSSG